MSRDGKVALSALREDAFSVDLVSPSGRHINLHMRSLRFREVLELRRKIQWPRPPVSDLRRNSQTGQVERVFNEQDPTYIADMETANLKLLSYGLLRAVQGLDVPGETEEEQITHLAENLETWAFAQLVDAYNRANGFTPPAMEAAKEALTPFGVGSLPFSPVSSGENEIGGG